MTMSETTPSQPILNEPMARFEINDGSQRAVLEYSISHGAMALVHTGVPKEMEGKGAGGALVKAALEYAKAQGLKVKPQCPFVRTWMERHPEYARLVG